MSEKDNPRFSRNLEISACAGDSRRTRRTPPEESAALMSPEEKQMYFGVEGRKILEMLACELERPEPDPATVILISDLHRSWHALWRGDDSFPVGPFSEMFELAFSVLSSIAVLGRPTNAEEKTLLGEFKEYMARLVAGNSGLNCLDSCRRLIEKAAPLAGKLKEDSMALSGKVCSQRELEGGNPVGRSRTVQGPAGRNDISSSVDEWFDQVTRLMVQPLAEGPGGEKATRRDGFKPMDPEKSLPELRPSAPLDNAPENPQIAFFQGEKPVGRIKETSTGAEKLKPYEAATAAKEIPQESADLTGTTEIPDTAREAPESGSSEVLHGVTESGPLPECMEPKNGAGEIAEDIDEILPEETPECAPEPVAGQSWDSPAPPPEVLAYIRDLSTVTLDVLRHNLAGIAESPGRRGARLAVEYLEQLRSVAFDFGLAERIPAVEEVCESLERLAASRSERERETFLRRVGEFADQVQGSLC